MYRVNKAAAKWEPKDLPPIDIKANTVVLRLYCEHKKVSKAEQKAAEKVMSHLEKRLNDETQQSAESYFGNVEGHDIVDHEIRVFLTGPDCDRLVTHLMPAFRTLPWSGRFHIVKRRGEFVDEQAAEEYVRLQ